MPPTSEEWQRYAADQQDTAAGVGEQTVLSMMTPPSSPPRGFPTSPSSSQEAHAAPEWACGLAETSSPAPRYHNNFREAGVAALKGRQREREPFLVQKEIEEKALRPTGEALELPGGTFTAWQLRS